MLNDLIYVAILHDGRLVALGGLVCLASAWIAFGIYSRLHAAGPAGRRVRLGAAGLVAGSGIWAAHFIAMLAFEPGFATGYEPALTLSSWLIAVVVCIAGLTLSDAPVVPARPVIGGAVLGSGIGLAHYTGMAGFRTQGVLIWNHGYIAASVLIGMVFAIVALGVVNAKPSRIRRGVATVVLTLGLCGMHYIGMGGVRLLPDPTVAAPAWIISNGALAVLAAGLAAMIWGGALGAFALSDRISKRAFEQLQAALADAETARTIALEHQEWASMAEQAAQVGHWRFEAKTRVSTWSDAVYRIYGLDPTREPPSVEVLRKLYGPDDWARVIDTIRRVSSTGEPFALDHRIVRPNGEPRFITMRGAAKRDRDGEVCAMIGVIIDVTEAKLAEKILQESEARLRFITDHSADTIIRYEAGGRILFVSEGARQRGWLPADVLGHSVSDHIHPDDRDRLRPEFQAFSAAGLQERTLVTEQRLLTRDGDWVWTEAATSAIRDESGRPMEFVAVLRDARQRKAMEDELRRKRAEAEAAALAKSEFLANMSHEIRTPLTAIVGFAGLLERIKDLPPDAQLYIKRVVAGGQSLLSVVNHILDFSKLEAGQVDLDLQPFSPAEFIDDVMAMVSAQADAKGLKLNKRQDGPLPVWINADNSRLRQILLNLLNNAIKFTSVGSVTVIVGYDFAEGGLRVAVSDTGAGVPQDKIGRLFERFSQVDGSIGRQHGGTGLGLAICKNLVELMQGEIAVDSKKDVGTTFSFVIPAPVVALQPANDQSPAAVAGPLAMQQGHILVVDDLDVNRELVRTLLEAMGFSVEEASGGEEAVEAAAATRFDLILMDMQMPGMDGLTATIVIRGTANPNSLTPIVALSANVLSDQVERCFAAGMNDHIAKPIKLDVLIDKVAAWAAQFQAPPPIDPVAADAAATRP